MIVRERTDIVLDADWMPVDQPLMIDDVCSLKSIEQDYICFDIIQYKQYQYLYFGSFDGNETVFAIQVGINGKNYIKTLSEKKQQLFAFNLYKTERTA